MAHILIKSGRNLEGVAMLTDIFLDKCDEVFNILAKKDSNGFEAQNSGLLGLLGKLLSNCSNEHRSDPVRGVTL